jgi:hypothetical protein
MGNPEKCSEINKLRSGSRAGRRLFKPEKLFTLVGIIYKFYLITITFLLGQFSEAKKLQGIFINFVAVGFLPLFYGEAVIPVVGVLHGEARGIVGPRQTGN